MSDVVVPWSDEHLQLILDAWDDARSALVERFPYGKEFVGTRPDIMSGLIHDGNGAYSLVLSAMTKDEVRWKRQNRGVSLRWFARFAEYVLEKEAPPVPRLLRKWSHYFNRVPPC